MRKIFAIILLLCIPISLAFANGNKDEPKNNLIEKPITIEEQANEINRIQKKAYDLLEYNLKTKTEEEAIKIVLDYLSKESYVTKAEVSEPTVGHGMPSICIIYKNGMEGVVTYRNPGYR